MTIIVPNLITGFKSSVDKDGCRMYQMTLRAGNAGEETVNFTQSYPGESVPFELTINDTAYQWYLSSMSFTGVFTPVQLVSIFVNHLKSVTIAEIGEMNIGYYGHQPHKGPNLTCRADI